MTNPYYTPTGQPIDYSRDVSSLIRSEFNLIQSAFNGLTIGFPGNAIVTGTCTSIGNAYTVAIPTATYASDMVVIFQSPATNTGAATLQINALGNIPWIDVNGNALPANAIKLNSVCIAIYIGGNFYLVSGGDRAPLTSPAFLVLPTAPTATVGTSTTQIATTAFVTATSFLSSLPGQANNAGKFVTTDGLNASWAALLHYIQIDLLSGYGANQFTLSNIGDVTSIPTFAKTAPQAGIFGFRVNQQINTAIPLKLRLHYTTDIAAGNVYLQLGYQSFAAGVALSPAAYTNAVDTLVAPVTAGLIENYLTVTAIIPAAALATQDWINCVVTRLATNGLDTNTGNFQLINIALEQ